MQHTYLIIMFKEFILLTGHMCVWLCFVLQDMVNRKISMRMMMQLAEDKPTRQFLFFTPQDMRYSTPIASPSLYC